MPKAADLKFSIAEPVEALTPRDLDDAPVNIIPALRRLLADNPGDPYMRTLWLVYRAANR